MAKLEDKFFNRVIEGKLSNITEEDAEEIGKVVKGGTKLYLHTMEIDLDETLYDFVALSLYPNSYLSPVEAVQLSIEGYIIIMTAQGEDFVGAASVGAGGFLTFIQGTITSDTVTPLD